MVKRKPRAHRKNVHFVFKAHPANEPHHSVYRGTNTYLYEDARGFAEVLGDRAVILKDNLRDRSLGKIARHTGVNILPGETAHGVKGALKVGWLRWLLRENLRRESKLKKSGTLESYREFLVSFAKLNRFRHTIIRENIAQLQGHGTIQSELGTAHSLLSSELRREGISSSRETLSPVVFTHNVALIRRLVRGVRPDSITDADYRRGLLSYRVSFNKRLYSTNAGITLDAILSRAVIDSLSDAQVSSALNDIARGRSLSIHREIGLPSRTTLPQLVAWVKKTHSKYRRFLERPDIKKVIREFE